MLAASLHIDYPMLFEISNPRGKKSSHCGVMEFVAEEGVIYLPYWVRPVVAVGASAKQLAAQTQGLMLPSSPAAAAEAASRAGR